MSAPSILFDFVVHVFLTSLPIVAGVLIARYFGVRHRLLLLSVGLCSLLVTGYLTFWIYWASSDSGQVFAIVLTLALVVVVVALGVLLREDLWAIGADLIKPCLLWVVSSLLILSLGLMYPSSANLASNAEVRFTPQVLPIDNEVPLILANALEAQRRPLPHPLYANWDSSDRPPLQTGIYLSQEGPLGSNQDRHAVHYEIVGVLLQGLWIFGIWALLSAIGARRRMTGLVLTAALFSGFVVVNTFYSWPKLFSAAYLAILAAILLTPAFKQVNHSIVAGAIAGALAGGALLAHEGSGLALLAFAIVMLFQRRIPSRRFLLGAAAVIVASYGTWTVYQKVIDPPGDQLARLQIANQPKLYAGDPRSLPTVIISAYESTPFKRIVDNKISNLDTPFQGTTTFVVQSARLADSYLAGGKSASSMRETALSDLRGLTFFYLVPSLGALALGFVAWAVVLSLRRRPTAAMQFAGTIWLFVAVNILTWALILFGPMATFLHQGTTSPGSWPSPPASSVCGNYRRGFAWGSSPSRRR